MKIKIAIALMIFAPRVLFAVAANPAANNADPDCPSSQYRIKTYFFINDNRPDEEKRKDFECKINKMRAGDQRTAAQKIQAYEKSFQDIKTRLCGELKGYKADENKAAEQFETGVKTGSMRDFSFGGGLSGIARIMIIKIYQDCHFDMALLAQEYAVREDDPIEMKRFNADEKNLCGGLEAEINDSNFNPNSSVCKNVAPPARPAAASANPTAAQGEVAAPANGSGKNIQCPDKTFVSSEVPKTTAQRNEWLRTDNCHIAIKTIIVEEGNSHQCTCDDIGYTVAENGHCRRDENKYKETCTGTTAAAPKCANGQQIVNSNCICDGKIIEMSRLHSYCSLCKPENQEVIVMKDKVCKTCGAGLSPATDGQTCTNDKNFTWNKAAPPSAPILPAATVQTPEPESWKSNITIEEGRAIVDNVVKDYTARYSGKCDGELNIPTYLQSKRDYENKQRALDSLIKAESEVRNTCSASFAGSKMIGSGMEDYDNVKWIGVRICCTPANVDLNAAKLEMDKYWCGPSAGVTKWENNECVCVDKTKTWQGADVSNHPGCIDNSLAIGKDGRCPRDAYKLERGINTSCVRKNETDAYVNFPNSTKLTDWSGNEITLGALRGCKTEENLWDRASKRCFVCPNGEFQSTTPQCSDGTCPAGMELVDSGMSGSDARVNKMCVITAAEARRVAENEKTERAAESKTACEQADGAEWSGITKKCKCKDKTEEWNADSGACVPNQNSSLVETEAERKFLADFDELTRQFNVRLLELQRAK